MAINKLNSNRGYFFVYIVKLGGVKSLEVKKKVVPLRSHSKRGLRRVLKKTDAIKKLKNFAKRFGD